MARTPQELTLALECYKQATISAEDALSKLLDNAIAKLREEDSIDIVRVLNFVSLVTTAVGYVMAPSTLGLASLLAGGTSMILEAAMSEPDSDPHDPLEIDGDNAVEILESLLDQYSTLKRSMVDFDLDMRRALQADLDTASSFAGSDLELRRPVVADHPEQFEHLELMAAPGVSIDENPVVESIVDLYRAGHNNLANAADLYGRAARTLDGVDLPTDPAALFGMSRMPFLGARREVTGVLLRTVNALSDAGAALVQIAQNYQLTDQERAETFRQIAQLAPPQSDAVGYPT